MSTLDILNSSFCLCKNPQRLPQAGKCYRCQAKKLNGLYFAISYKNNLVKNLIHQFKYDPYVKELSVSLSSLIITHLLTIQKSFDRDNSVLIPVPVTKKRKKLRGFNPSEEIAKELAKNLNLPLLADCLIKIKETRPQMELSAEERMENIKGVFAVENAEKIKDKKILLVDDVYTTGSTMEECAGALKGSGAFEVWGVVVAREE
ncbi:MAG: phosphoribosyltransferase family protein [Candidatus Pacebacteria bacterium]|nr:phosphoribosyltransferase family protein [Candidatus Paceibacterota bacterium]